MEVLYILDDIIRDFFLVYGCALLVIYIAIPIFSAIELGFYTNKNKHVDYQSMLSFERLPSVSILAPAYNEEKSIIANIRCLLSIYYPNLELIIINDGSTDNSLNRIIDYFNLVKVDMAFSNEIKTARVRGVYKSKNTAWSYLTVVDKENGGKADALNAGINVSKSDLILSVDVDCIIEPDAIIRMVKPFLEEEDGKVVIASGGVIRIANSCEIENGHVVNVKYPDNFWARFQVLEYFRAFSLGRMAWSKLNGLLIISGAFGMFDRERVLKVGGYDTSTVGEDLELVVRLRKYMHNVEKRKYKVAFIPDPLCWTEAPETLKILSRQRNRWARGAVDTILKHRDMFMNKKYGIIGMFSFPYWVLFEWLAPIIQTVGLVYFSILMILGLLSIKIFFIFLMFVLTFSVMYSISAVFIEAFSYNKYQENQYLKKILTYSVLETFIYQPLNVLFSLKGNYDFFIKNNKKEWGIMTRTGFAAQRK